MAQNIAWLFVVVIGLICTANGEWDYHEHGPTTWADEYPECSASHQSPMALYRAKSYLMPQFTRSYSVTFKNYNTAIDAIFSNNGHTTNLALNYPDHSTAPQVVVSGTDVDGAYILAGLHFHWPSEHTIDDTRYDLEMHMVHKDPYTNQTLVLGYLFEACWSSGTGINILASQVRDLIHYGDSVKIANFVPSKIMPVDYKCNYFVYSGSLTTPPCSEDVTWMVHTHPICIAQTQLKNFYFVLDEEGDSLNGNNRPLQPRNGRNLFYQSCYY